ncbi:nucleotidyltransferase family protein [Streptomyces candidus]|uniref:Nicotine blue oxidoreductase n=1 Tax=Streptomyces candidus TaxID=67283 RepID=A0A7X0LNI8_9ACTN|nr:nucleotidyltransferase family protein [Streptomyces candidus]MBB6434534.1 nicotine blue oxidoreductase [Streptomyces candidus]GHH36381.1 4-diphosphocytidyl-2C-methyl-D-erythritol synthase [Streptomyces candidus]
MPRARNTSPPPDPARPPSTAPAASTAGLLLAAGAGRRLGGRPKALLTHRGRPLVEHAVRALWAGGCSRVYVVLGAASDEVRAHADLDGCVLVDSPHWADGMGSSLRAGLAALPRDGRYGAVLVSLVDQPGIGAAAVARVLAASGTGLAAAAYDGERGHPVLFGSDRWPDVARSAVGDRGARAYLTEHADALTLVECGDVAEAYDIDLPEDLSRLDGAGGPAARAAT